MSNLNVVHAGPAANVAPICREAKIKAAQVIYPGYLVEYSSGEWQVQSTEGQGGDFYIANLNQIEQKNATTALTAGDNAQVFVPQVGDMYVLVLQDGETAVLGSPLTSNGDGTVKVSATDGTEANLFSAEEALSPSGADGRILARYTGVTISADTTA